MMDENTPGGGRRKRRVIDVSTRKLSASDKMEFWADIARHAVTSCEVSSPAPRDFDIAARGVVQHDISLLRIESTSFDVVRSPDHSKDGNDDAVLFFFVKLGRLGVRQDGREIVVGSNDGVSVVANRPYQLQIEGSHAVNAIRVPRLCFKSRSTFEKVTARRLSEAGTLGRASFAFSDWLCENPSAMDNVLLGRLTQSLTNLLTATHGVLIQAAGQSRRSQGKDAALRRAKAFIDVHVLDAGLTTASIAERLGLSQRYLRKCFELEEVSLSAYIRDQRLDRAASALTNTFPVDRPVKAVASAHGFKDVSHFSQAFRRRFHKTPAQFRSEAWNALGLDGPPRER